MKKLIVFDLDGTLAESKSSLDAEMAQLLTALLTVVRVAVISGGDWPQFQKQVLSKLPLNECLDKLSLLPACGTKFYEHAGEWQELYSEDFTANEKEKITASLKQAVGAAGFEAKKTWGGVIEDRGSQITFSALGQQAPIEEKEKWDPDFAKRQKMKVLLDQLIPEFSVRPGRHDHPSTSPNTASIRPMESENSGHPGIAIDEMIFVGDALFPGGNDYPAKEAGALSIQVKRSARDEAGGPRRSSPVWTGALPAKVNEEEKG